MQDALLYDQSRSFFSSVGYVRTANFQSEIRDIDSSNNANLGTTVQWTIPKAADLLTNVDLELTMAKPTQPAYAGGLTQSSFAAIASWVESLGYAMIDRVTLSIGSNEIET